VATCPGKNEFGASLFSMDLDHGRRLTTSGLDIPSPPISLAGETSSRHGNGFEHRDASTTLRNYAHAMPLENEAVADDIEEVLRSSGQLRLAAAQTAN
jgi:hypothetical protein